MFEYDMCLCASKECPKYQECLRGAGVPRKGIYTSSFLSEVCNEDNNYEYKIDVEKQDEN